MNPTNQKISAVSNATNSIPAFVRFFWAGLVNHGQTGGLIPSQRFLIEKMIAPIPRQYPGTVVELGAGNGALTVRLARRCPEARILACEINPVLAADHRSSLSGARLNSRVELFRGSAAELFSQMQNKNFPAPDFVVSGVPLGNLGREQTNALIDSIHSLLNRGGLYIQFQHSLLDRKKIKNRFRTLRTIPVFLNIPPAVVYYARK